MSGAAAVAGLLAAFAGVSSAQKCAPLDGSWRNPAFVRAVPGPEVGLKVNSTCRPWADSSCCTQVYTDALYYGGEGAIYPGFSYDVCTTQTRPGGGGNYPRVSDRCRQYMLWEESFYSCDPYAAYFNDPQYPGSFLGLPLCKSFCDDWYSACHDDFNCIKDWSTWYPNNVTGVYTCEGNGCATFGSMYTSGSDMCTAMWGTSFTVSANPLKCYSPYFYSVNPNAGPAGIKTSGSGAVGMGSMALSALGAAAAAVGLGGA